MTKPTEEQIEVYREEVCGCCPGSLWGAKSVCRVHQLSIGLVESCPEWEAATSAVRAGASGKERSVMKTEQMEQIEEEMKNYAWMVREIERLRRLLDQFGTGLTGRYGLDAGQPHGKGGYADPVRREAQRREKHWMRLKQLEEKVKRLESAADRVRDDRQRTVLECIMEGQRMNAIARHIGVSRQRLHELKLDLVRQLAEHIFGTEQKDIS